MKMCPFLSQAIWEEKEGKTITRVIEVMCQGDKCFFWTQNTCTFVDRTPFNLLSTKITSSIEKGFADNQGSLILLKEVYEKTGKEFAEKIARVSESIEKQTGVFPEILQKLEELKNSVSQEKADFEKMIQEMQKIAEDFKKRVENYEKIQEQLKLSSIYEKILFLFSRGEYDLAWEEIEKVKDAQKDTRFRILEATILLKKGDRNSAKQIFEELMDKGISSKEIFNNLGIIYYEGGNFEKAVEIFDKGLKFSREFPEILYNMGLALYKKGEIEKAFESWERVLEIDPEFIEAQEAIQKYREGK